MIEDNKRLAIYLDVTVNNVFKILPLYEEGNVGLDANVESLLSELISLKKVVKIEFSYEYISLLATLTTVKDEIIKEDSQHSVIKRELFKSIDIIKKMVTKLEEGS